MWLIERCVQYLPGTGPHPGSGCDQVSSGISWDTNLRLAVIGGLALMAIAVALWFRLPRLHRIAAAGTVATVAIAANVIALADSRVGGAVSDLLSAL